MPAVYFQSQFIIGGGLISYGSDWVTSTGRAAVFYVDRILRARTGRNCRCMAPTKYELADHLKAAKANRDNCATSLLARADEVIEWMSVTSGIGTFEDMPIVSSNVRCQGLTRRHF